MPSELGHLRSTDIHSRQSCNYSEEGRRVTHASGSLWILLRDIWSSFSCTVDYPVWIEFLECLLYKIFVLQIQRHQSVFLLRE